MHGEASAAGRYVARLGDRQPSMYRYKPLHSASVALIAQLGERQTEDLKVHSSILCQSTLFAALAIDEYPKQPSNI